MLREWNEKYNQPFHFGETISTDIANYRGTDHETYNWSGSYGKGEKGVYRKETTNVDQFNVANGFGLSEMHGNVWEWCQDKYRSDAYSMELSPEESYNPAGPAESFDPGDPLAEKFVVRGGSYLCSDSYCSGYRVARRMRTTPDTGMGHLGFRCVRDIAE